MRDQLKIFATDITRGSVRSRSRRPMYALVRLVDGEIVAEEEVSQFRLLRLLNTEKPDILAVDSIQELAADQRELYALLQALPPQTRLVQVTGGERTESLARVAGRYNIKFNRLSPFDEARTIGLVASLGAGAQVIAFENATEIVVSRHRSPGKGGWSQNRYVRKIHGGVQRWGRDVEMALINAGLKYQKKEMRAFGGASRVAFEVAASRDKIPVSTYRGADVQVRISGKRLERIRFEPLTGKPKYLIVGVDPGTTMGYAALDLAGNLVRLNSSRQMTTADLVEDLCKAGRPLVIASDVEVMPFSVEKLRRSFCAVGYSPRQDLSVENKLELARPYPYRNDHERDSLSAALDAYRQYKNRFQSLLRRVPAGHDLDEVKAGIIRGQSLEQVLIGLRARGAVPAVTTPPPTPPRAPELSAEAAGAAAALLDDQVRQLDGVVKRLRGFLVEMQDELNGKDREIRRLQNRLNRVSSVQGRAIRADAEVARKDAEIQSLKKRLRKEERTCRSLKKRVERLKEIETIQQDESEELVPVKILAAFTRDAVRTLTAGVGVKAGDLVFIRQVEGWGRTTVRDLVDLGVRGLIVGRGNEKMDPQLVQVCRELALPLLSGEETGAVMKGGIVLAEKVKVDVALLRWETGQEEYQREKNKDLLEGIFLEYRSERGKEVRRHG